VSVEMVGNAGRRSAMCAANGCKALTVMEEVIHPFQVKEDRKKLRLCWQYDI